MWGGRGGGGGGPQRGGGEEKGGLRVREVSRARPKEKVGGFSDVI